VLRGYIKVETALTRRLLRAWRPLASTLFEPVATALESKKFGAAYDAAYNIDLRGLSWATSEQAKYMLYEAAAFGATMASSRRKTVFTSGSYDRTLARVGRQFSLSIERNMTMRLHKLLVQLIADVENEGTIKKSAASKRYVREFVSFEEGGDEALQMVSSLHSSRMAVWGFTSEAESRGVEEYQLNAVLDGRTSDFCRTVHGRRFKVEDGRNKIVAALDVEDPEDLRIVHPWPKQTRKAIEQYKAMTSDELRALGFLVPPFHPRCRTLCQLVQKAGDVLYLPPAEPDFKEPVTAAAFEAIGIKISPDEVEAWNKLPGVTPAAALKALTGLETSELVDQPLGAQKFFSFMEDGSLKMKATGAMAGEGSEVSVAQVFDQVTGKLYQTWAEVPGPGSGDFVRGLYRRGADLTAAMKGEAYVISTTGAEGAFVHARIGFLPETSEAWALLQAGIENDLLPGGALEELMPTDLGLQNLLLGILDDQDPKGFWALAALPMGKELLAGRTVALKLLINDAEAMVRFDGVLP
jgi:hypothetical protein